VEIPELDLPLCNCGAAVVTSATDWQTRVYDNQRRPQAEKSVRLREIAIPKLNEITPYIGATCIGAFSLTMAIGGERSESRLQSAALGFQALPTEVGTLNARLL